MTISEKTQHSEKLKWGFPQPTLLIDSQSAPKLIGDVIEQQYFRMFLMGKPEDVALVNYPINSAYLGYIQNTLGIPLPTIVPIENTGKGTLTRDILNQPEVMMHMQELVDNGHKIQFFNFLQDEVELAHAFTENPTYAKNLEAYLKLGTKTGFREFCQKYHVPIPQGAICHTPQAVSQVLMEIDEDCIVKSDEGTGGAELGSNVPISKDEILAAGKDIEILIGNKLQQLTPAEPPYDVQQKLKNVTEGSLHIFINSDGTVAIDPVVFGQFAHEGSYVGGHYPNHLPQGFNEKLIQLANEIIIPALKEEGATGMHCMDCLFNPKTHEVAFIEDNTRPGALDFVHHFVMKIAEANKLTQPHWFHYQLPIKKIAGRAVPFEELQEILGEQLKPSESFVAISNPNVLSYGYDIHLTGISGGENGSDGQAMAAYAKAVETLKKHFGYEKDVSLPQYEE